MIWEVLFDFNRVRFDVKMVYMLSMECYKTFFKSLAKLPIWSNWAVGSLSNNLISPYTFLVCSGLSGSSERPHEYLYTAVTLKHQQTLQRSTPCLAKGHNERGQMKCGSVQHWNNVYQDAPWPMNQIFAPCAGKFSPTCRYAQFDTSECPSMTKCRPSSNTRYVLHLKAAS